MKKLLVASVLFAAVAAYAYEFTPFDWKEAVESGQTTVTLSENKAYLVTEDDMAYLNKLTVSVGNHGYLVLSNATTACSATIKSFGGSIVKMGLSRQEFKGQIINFTSIFRIEEGTAVYANHYSFGDPMSEYTTYGYPYPRIDVLDGATAEIGFASSAFCIRGIHVAGRGVDDAGAIVIKAGDGLIQKSTSRMTPMSSSMSPAMSSRAATRRHRDIRRRSIPESSS